MSSSVLKVTRLDEAAVFISARHFGMLRGERILQARILRSVFKVESVDAVWQGGGLVLPAPEADVGGEIQHVAFAVHYLRVHLIGFYFGGAVFFGECFDRSDQILLVLLFVQCSG